MKRPGRLDFNGVSHFMKIINLTNSNLVVMVDDEDFNYLNTFKWFTHKIKKQMYAYSNINGKQTRMHRIIMNPKNGEFVDHIDGDKLNNQKVNLRICSLSENNRNSFRKYQTSKTTSYKGVSLKSGRKQYDCRISVDKKLILIGNFDCQHKAALAYNREAVRYHGEFARLNIVGVGCL